MELLKSGPLAEEILNKTRSGKLRWDPTAEEGVYLAVVSGEFVLLLRRDRLVLVVRDVQDRELLRIEPGNSNTSDLEELAALVERQAAGLRPDDAKLQRLLGELIKL